jgi:putative endonuclease
MFEWWRRLFQPAWPDPTAGVPTRAGAGARGERLAAEFLQRERGLTIVARNWRNPRDRRDELDLVARDGEVLVFVEVKARAAGALVSGYYTVDERKKKVLRRTIKAYLAGLKTKPLTVRFDVVEVALTPVDAAKRDDAPEIHHFAGVPLFPPRWRP